VTLTRVTRAPRLRRLITYDMEWIPGTLEIRVICVYDGDRARAYATVKDFLDGELTNRNRGAWFWAHAGGKFDLQFVVEEIAKQSPRYSLNGCRSGSSYVIANIKSGHNVWKFIDSYWLFQSSLAEIGKAIGIPKTGPKHDRATQDEIAAWYASVPFEELREYCINDCVILWEALHAFECTLRDLGSELNPTIASTAMRLFRGRYLTEEIVTSDTVNEATLGSYFSSRVEIFNRYIEAPAKYYDINSSFPFAMCSPVPGNLIGSYGVLKDSLIQSEIPYFVNGAIEIPDCYLPPLPYRRDHKVYFPTGKWSGWFTGIDIELMLECGGKIRRIDEVLVFDANQDLQQYAMDIYALRKATDDPFERLLYKRLLNSCYGKFGERETKESLYLNPDSKTLARLSEDDMLLPGFYRESVTRTIEHRHIPAASYIVARSRGFLARYLMATSSFHYCDCDGFSSCEDFETGNELGDLKMEKELEIESTVFVQPKAYRMDAWTLKDGIRKREIIVKAKGMSLDKAIVHQNGREIRIEKEEAFERLLGGERIQVRGMKSLLCNLKDKNIRPVEELRTKRFNMDGEAKRFFYPDGSTRPWSVRELKK
jgi:hypothetical protein